MIEQRQSQIDRETKEGGRKGERKPDRQTNTQTETEKIGTDTDRQRQIEGQRRWRGGGGAEAEKVFCCYCCLLFKVPITRWCISGTYLLRQLYVLPH